MGATDDPTMVTDADDDDLLTIRPLGAGQEVGRSCVYMEFKNKKILFDCGIHPGMSGVDSLPFVDLLDCEELDLLLITHFHLDHCGALPWFLEKTAFRGRCFMTHATKAIYRMLIADYIKVSTYGGNERVLYTEEDLERSLDKIEVIDYHEQKEVNGIRFWPYVAGHVLGAAMFMVEVAGVKTLYTGDFSREEDRHLCAAETPAVRPDILITESTYGTQLHEGREQRERRFTTIVHDIVGRGGRCLIPAFALGRAQELLLILDEYWANHPELHDIPIYYASSLAKKCMSVYQTFVGSMNQTIQRQVATNNPFVFKHISNLKSIENFDDMGPCVVLASPGMLQSGLSRELFESWCTDPKNGCIVAGYCVEGTLAKTILSEPEEITAMNGQKLPMRLQVAYISFSAHTDYRQTSAFIRELKPPHIILVHGEMNEMNRLKAAIVREYEDDTETQIDVYNPANTMAVELHFRGEKTAKVVGQLAIEGEGETSSTISGVLVRRNFNYHLMHPKDLASYTELAHSELHQRQSVFYSGAVPLLVYFLQQIAGDVYTVTETDLPEEVKVRSGEKTLLRVFDGAVSVCVDGHVVYIDWLANPVNDMYADATLAAVLQAEANPIPVSHLPKNEPDVDLRSCLTTALREVCGEQSIDDDMTEEASASNIITMAVDGRPVRVDIDKLDVQCEDSALRHLLTSVVHRTGQCLAPVNPPVDAVPKETIVERSVPDVTA